MSVVDDPYDFGRIAAANAISDVYAMGGKPLMAVAILGWPVSTLAPEVAARVIEGGRAVCGEAGIALAGGHSIDSPEPIFGLAVTGQVSTNRIIRNDRAREGDLLYLTKPLGVGILTSASKKRLLTDTDLALAVKNMTTLNKPGEVFAKIAGVHAMTDVTGFGLAGHLLEVCRGSRLSARIDRNALPIMPNLSLYIAAGCIPGGTYRNANAFGSYVHNMTESDSLIMCDPQTSGGLLVAVAPSARAEFEQAVKSQRIMASPFGEMIAQSKEAGCSVIYVE